MLVHTYYGFNASGGPAGVGEAVGRAVRASLVVAVRSDVGGLAGRLRAVRPLQPVRVATMRQETARGGLHPASVDADPVRLSSSALIALTSARSTGTSGPYARVTLTSDRAGLVMEPGAKVKLRGVQVGRVASIQRGKTR